LKCNGVSFVGPARRSSEELRHASSVVVTTLTINSVPIGVGKHQLLDLLDQTGFKGRYDYLYLPCNYSEGTNRGHAFIDLCTPQDAEDFFAAWHGARLDGSLLSISVCTEQGFRACVARWTPFRMRRLKSEEFTPFIRGK
jgi:hypothetical protein